jgi:hypothetical protein
MAEDFVMVRWHGEVMERDGLPDIEYPVPPAFIEAIAAVTGAADGRLLVSAFQPLDARAIRMLTGCGVKPAPDGTVCLRPNNWEYTLDASAGMGQAYAARDAVEHDQVGAVADVDLGDHPALVRRAVQLAHEVVCHAGHGRGREADGVLQRQREVSAEAVGLEAAGLDDATGAAHQPWQREAVPPVAAGRLDQLPVVGAQLVEDDDPGVEVLQ